MDAYTIRLARPARAVAGLCLAAAAGPVVWPGSNSCITASRTGRRAATSLLASFACPIVNSID